VDPDAPRHLPFEEVLLRGTVAADGEEVAWDTIRLKLQELIGGEEKQHPKSDDQLSRTWPATGSPSRGGP